MALVDVDVEGLPDSDAVPAGKYDVRIDTVSEPAEDKNEESFVKVGFTITDGEYTNRKIYENYVNLTKMVLKKILRAGKYSKPHLSDTNDMIGLEMKVVTKVEKDEIYGEQSRISVYLPK